MKLKHFFQLFSILLSYSTLAQVGLAPLSQYSVGYSENAQLRTTALTQDDTLKLPFIEDFSGSYVPLEKITVDTFATTPGVELVYRLTYLMLHGLTTGDSIRVFSTVTTNPSNSNAINGTRYVIVIDKYTIQLFNDKTFSTPTYVNPSDIMRSTNWIPLGVPLYSATPNPLYFVDENGGTYINNTMATKPINIGVASFDGANYKGFPYSTGTTKGYADKLTSLPINLASNKRKDSIYLSFYWQSKSLGNTPLQNEFLSLQFKDSTKNNPKWNEVWRQTGGTTTVDTFIKVTIPIKDTIYLHKGFQFRFQSYGVLYGRYNVWNVDYIYIDTNRTAKDSLKDILIINTNQGCLKNYTSIPYKHINGLSLTDIQAQKVDSAYMLIRNGLFGSPEISIDHYHVIKDNFYNNISSKTNSSIPSTQNYIETFSDSIPTSLMTAPYVLKEEFSFAQADTTDRYNLSFNNFAAVETVFSDYYSYDDYIPESTVYTTNPGGIKLAHAITILKTDTLTNMDFCFLRNSGPDMSNTEIFMNVWEKGSNPTDPTKPTPILKLLLNQKIGIQYSTNINGFVRYQLYAPLVLSKDKTYLFGFTQNVIDPLFIGYDRNNDHIDDIYVSLDNINWEPFSNYNKETGSLMIRPVFGQHEVITSIKPNQSEEQIGFTIFPNPAQAELLFTGEPEYISVYDISGLLLFEKNVQNTTQISTDALVNGLYIVILSKGNYKEKKRLIIQK